MKVESENIQLNKDLAEDELFFLYKIVSKYDFTIDKIIVCKKKYEPSCGVPFLSFEENEFDEKCKIIICLMNYDVTVTYDNNGEKFERFGKLFASIDIRENDIVINPDKKIMKVLHSYFINSVS